MSNAPAALPNAPPAAGAFRAIAARIALAVLLFTPLIAPAQDLETRALEIETYLNAYPERAVTELTALAARADAASPAERRDRKSVV